MLGQDKPLQVNLHNAQKAMSNQDQAILKNSAKAKELAAKARLNTEKRQEDIDHYNMVTCNIIDPAFDNIQLLGLSLIVRLHKENYIKAVDLYTNDVPMYDAWIRQVDGRMHQSHKEKWVDNPLPYIRSGVVVAMSPALIADQQDDYNKLLEANPDTDFTPIQVGDIVQLEHFMIADRRFYLNKQLTDFIRNPENFRIQHFEGYIKINIALVEGKVKDNAKFLETISPYYQYKQWLASNGKEVKSTVEDLDLNTPISKSFGRIMTK